jgi:hypothetical protein
LVDGDVSPLIDSVDVLEVGEHPLENLKMMDKRAPQGENSAARAKRLAEQLRFKLREAMAQRGRPDAFLHWLRTDGGKNG